MKQCLLLIFFFFVTSCIFDSKVDDLKKVKEGMTNGEVENILGKPDSILHNFFQKEEFTYMYNASMGMSDNIYINFSRKDSIVISVIDGQ